MKRRRVQPKLNVTPHNMKNWRYGPPATIISFKTQKIEYEIKKERDYQQGKKKQKAFNKGKGQIPCKIKNQK